VAGSGSPPEPLPDHQSKRGMETHVTGSGFWAENPLSSWDFQLTNRSPGNREKGEVGATAWVSRGGHGPVAATRRFRNMKTETPLSSKTERRGLLCIHNTLSRTIQLFFGVSSIRQLPTPTQ
jgi:hypothetical protein